MSSTRVERKVNDLIEDDPEMADALATIRTRSEANGNGVEWGDVKDEITSGQWGRLIQKGVVVDNEDGKFELAEPEAVDAALGDERTKTVSKTPSDKSADEEATEDDDGGWSTMDKAAGAGVALIMIGYYYNPVQNVVGGAINVFMGPVDAALPFYVVIMILAMITGVFSSVLRSNLMDGNSDMAQYQEMQEELKEREKRAKENDDEEELQQIREERMEMMSESMGMMTQQFKPMVYIMLVTIPMFLWMWWSIGSTGGTIGGVEHYVASGQPGAIFPMVGEVGWNDSVLGPMQAWIVWYFLCSMGFTQLIQKSIDLDMTPTTS